MGSNQSLLEKECVDARSMKFFLYVPLLVPIILFLVSLQIRPTVGQDSGIGFVTLRSMLQGGGVNYFISPDPANIANDLSTFLTWFSPGQYLVPGAFVWLGIDYKSAISLTVLISSVVGVIGWAKVAQTFAARPSVIFIFLCGLVLFRYGTLPFQMYTGGEVLLFAAAPWSFCWLWSAIEKPPVACFTFALMSLAILFFAKLTGLVVFAANVLAISLLELLRKRRVTSAMLALWTASGVGVISFIFFWHSHGGVPADGSRFAVTLPAVWFPLAGAALSGVSGVDLLNWILHHRSTPMLLALAILVGLIGVLVVFWKWNRIPEARYKVAAIIGLLAVATLFSGVFAAFYVWHNPFSFDQRNLRDAGLLASGLFGLVLTLWVWGQLRSTRYRPMTICFFAIIAFYTIAFILMYSGGSSISLEERHLRYAGILFFLMILVALDLRREFLAKGLTLMIFCGSVIYSLASYVVDARELTKGRYYEQLSFNLLQMVPSSVLEYLRSQATENNWRRPVVVISPQVALDLPSFRIIEADLDFIPIETIHDFKWAGHAEKIIMVVPDQMAANGKAEALLKRFVDYDQSKWSQMRVDGMVIYSQ
ncbi:hypothetical protein [Bradyrhizobium erythrophlei]|uniref:4-amino-4-deoxy-L-arabinose transferase n=1 Tax=Bradyrhizobium erythrophlei TaxID=1437360 RepID=A0A1M5PCC7_9BRAD|nr:hypothetical protein [Bradyrhizobium erythrophlei]SHG99412.1 hypothetical protein SAMN05444169_5163 [Bradyrhizobium erythrophlei]